MIISHKHKFVFVKTRKTAGSTLEQILRPCLGEDDILTGSTRDGTPPLNCKPDQDGHRVPKIPEGYMSFSIERNPWDKVVSSYYWHKKIKSMAFGDWDFERYVLYSGMLPTDWHSYQVCDTVYKYEEMEAMYMSLMYHYNLDFNLELIYTTRLKSDTREISDYRELHTPKTKDWVAHLFAREIERFGYEF